ncbi:TorF family putative porin [Paraferrimonas haliotis]|uniref:Outer membrane protein beta-barrel domain-containing protein n=1 Tax=Paraferrimonas haliotis TaxID=2013866 RepID=A0AA37TS71_9GAMM|nr:TorF family putative porin [Paraferrimonas haliotis]GLS82179.1 hypothetical protein GCM10007894_01560 [Paraferrimonas haliotis]
MMKRTISASLLALSLGYTAPTLAQESPHSFSGNAALVSNYLFRGVTLSDDKPALQVGGDYEHASGFYAGVWGSSYDNGGDTEVEVDWWGGYSFAINDDISLDFSATRYYYYDVGGHTTEYKAAADLYGANVAAHYDVTLKSWYFEANYDFALAEALTLTPHAGIVRPDEDDADSAYDLGVTLDYGFNDYLGVFAGVVYHEEEKEAYVVGVTASF